MLPTNSIASVLLVGGGRDGIAVVTTEEYQWALEGGREVEAGVCVPFAGCSLSEITDYSTVHVFSLDGICSSSRWNRHQTWIHIHRCVCVCVYLKKMLTHRCTAHPGESEWPEGRRWWQSSGLWSHSGQASADPCRGHRRWRNTEPWTNPGGNHGTSALLQGRTGVITVLLKRQESWINGEVTWMSKPLVEKDDTTVRWAYESGDCI